MYTRKHHTNANEVKALLDSNLAEIYFIQGNHYQAEGNFSEAIEHYTMAISLNTQYVLAYAARGKLHHRQGNLEKATKDYGLAIYHEGAFAYKNKDEATQYLLDKLKEYSDEIAILLLQQALDKTTLLGAIFWKQRLLTKTSLSTGNLAKLFTRLIDILIQQASLHAVNNQYNQAIQYYTQVIQLIPKNSALYCNRGVAYAKIDEYDKAIQDYTDAIQLRPKKADIYLNRAISYGKQGKHEQAIQDYIRAIQLNTSQPSSAYNNIGVMYYEQKKYQAAIEQYSAAIRFDPNDALYYANRGAAHKQQGDVENARNDYQTARTLDPMLANVYITKGDIFQKKGNFLQAIDRYSIAIQIDPASFPAYERRSAAYYAEGDIQKSREDFTQALLLHESMASNMLQMKQILDPPPTYEETMQKASLSIPSIPYYNVMTQELYSSPYFVSQGIMPSLPTSAIQETVLLTQHPHEQTAWTRSNYPLPESVLNSVVCRTNQAVSERRRTNLFFTQKNTLPEKEAYQECGQNNFPTRRWSSNDA